MYETEKIQKLEERVKELEEQFSEAHRDHEITTKVDETSAPKIMAPPG